MQKFLITLAITFLILFPQSLVFAAPDISMDTIAKNSGYDTNIDKDTAVSAMAGKVVKVVLGMTGTIFLVLTVYAGILWMTAQGKDEQVEKATGIIKMAVIGLIITLSAYSITAFITSQ